MNKTPDTDQPQTSNLTTRRDAIKKTGFGVGALAGVAIPHVHAQNDDPTIRIGLIGCGGRGGGAVLNALKTSTEQGPVRLHALADVFQEKVDEKERSFTNAEQRPDVANKVDLGDRKFIGFDAYKKAMDTLSPGDVAILTTPCAFRWPMYEYAIERGLNVFMEKPVCPDGPSGVRLLEMNKKAKAKNLKVGVGLMCRHCDARGELFNRVRDGQMGEIVMMRGYRMQTPIASCFSDRNPGNVSDLMYQIQRFHSFLWLSGGSFSDFFIHNIDECCWIKDQWPVDAKAIGGRHYRGDKIDQNFDSYSVEYTFPDGTKLFMDGRNVPGCHNEFASLAHGTKGCAVISESGHAPSRARIYKGQVIQRQRRRGGREGQAAAEAEPAHPDLLWAYPQDPAERNPYDLEWEHLIDAIHRDVEYNEVDRGVQASLVTAMGRMAAHTGQVISYDQVLKWEHEFSPKSDTLTLDGDSPIMPNADGSYPIPEPGVKKDREY
jgi:predicted dehydrogenase